MLAATADAGLHSLLDRQGAEGLDDDVAQVVPDDDLAGLERTRHGHRPTRLFHGHARVELPTGGGGFDWHVNPSTRPFVAGRPGATRRAAAGGDRLTNPAGQPGTEHWTTRSRAPRGVPVQRRRACRGVDNGASRSTSSGPTPRPTGTSTSRRGGQHRRAVGLLRRHDRGRGRCSIRRRGRTGA